MYRGREDEVQVLFLAVLPSPLPQLCFCWG